MATLFMFGHYAHASSSLELCHAPTIAPRKKATNITLSVDVLRAAKALGINISQACDEFLRGLVRREQERRW